MSKKNKMVEQLLLKGWAYLNHFALQVVNKMIISKIGMKESNHSLREGVHCPIKFI